MAVKRCVSRPSCAWAAWLRHDGAPWRLTVGLRFPPPATYSSCSEVAGSENDFAAEVSPSREVRLVAALRTTTIGCSVSFGKRFCEREEHDGPASFDRSCNCL